MNGLKIAKGFSLPLDTVTSTQAVLGIKGSGKTNTAVVMVEELIRLRQQVVIIDPTDVWWGLKSSRDGAEEGLPVVVLGGRRADLPLDEHAGATVADFAVDHGANLVLSLRHLSNGAKRRFVTAFANRLYQRKGGDDPTPLMVVIDEAHLTVPQRVGAAEAEMVGAIQQLVRQGRASGIGVTLIDQRAASVNKDVLTQVELLVCHRTIGPQDRKALEAWVEQNASEEEAETFFRELTSLPRGTAWYWSPAWLQVFRSVAVNERRTFDSSRTPKPGEKIAPPKAVAPVDLDALKVKMSATLEKAKADDPALLRKRIVELERGVKDMVHRAVQPARAVVDQGAIDRAVAAAVVGPTRRVELLARQVGKGFAQIRGIMELIEKAMGEGSAVIVTTIPRQPVVPMRALVPTGRAPAAPVHTNGDGPVTPSDRKVLDAIAAFEGLGMPTPKRVNVAFFAGYTEGGRYNNIVGALKSRGLIDYPSGGSLALTDDGRALADGGASITSLAELHATWLGKLPPSEAKVLKVLLDAYPDGLSREELGRSTDYVEGGRFNNIIGRLSGLGAVVYPRAGHVAAAETLFPEGLA